MIANSTSGISSRREGEGDGVREGEGLCETGAEVLAWELDGFFAPEDGVELLPRISGIASTTPRAPTNATASRARSAFAVLEGAALSGSRPSGCLSTIATVFQLWSWGGTGHSDLGPPKTYGYP